MNGVFYFGIVNINIRELKIQIKIYLWVRV